MEWAGAHSPKETSAGAHPPEAKQTVSFKLNAGLVETLEVQSPTQLTLLTTSLRGGCTAPPHPYQGFEMLSHWKISPLYCEVLRESLP